MEINRPPKVKRSSRWRPRPLDALSSLALMVLGIAVIVAQGDGEHPIAYWVAGVALAVSLCAGVVSAVTGRRKPKGE